MFRVYHKGEGCRDATERGELLPLVLAAKLLKALCPTGDCLCHLIDGLFIIWKVIRKSRGKMMNLICGCGMCSRIHLGRIWNLNLGSAKSCSNNTNLSDSPVPLAIAVGPGCLYSARCS